MKALSVCTALLFIFSITPVFAQTDPETQITPEILSQIEQAAEQGDAEAQFILGLIYYDGEGVSQDYTKALYWYEKAAEQGDLNGKYMLGALHINGTGVIRDQTIGCGLVREAAEQGHREAIELYNEICAN